MDRSADVEKLRQVAKLVEYAVETVIAQWSKGDAQKVDSVDGVEIPCHDLYNAQRTLAAAAGTIEELVCDPSLRILAFSTQYYESRALHIAAEHRVADLLDAGDHEKGVHVTEIGKRVSIQSDKLSRILRLLTSQHIFRETNTDTFANNVVSQALVRNEPLRAYVTLFALDPFSAADYLPTALKHPKLGPSYQVNETAFNLAVGTDASRWEWLQEIVPSDKLGVSSRGYPTTSTTQANGKIEGSQTNGDSRHRRPELEIFNLAMVGGGKVSSTPHVLDYPWHELGDATVVDVGGGHGGFVRQLSRQYPHFKCIVQDSQAMVDRGREVWQQEKLQDLASDRVRFMAHDFFTVNPIKGAEVYWLRYILHDWSDDYCVNILSRIREAMGPSSRILIADQVMDTTIGSPDLMEDRAPVPLLANYGQYVRYSHQRDLGMMALINGIERTPAQFRSIIEAAGLQLVKIWQCRTQVSIVECRL
ncbi:putative O-methyltransferase domain-containing protein [Seiridium cardinale]